MITLVPFSRFYKNSFLVNAFMLFFQNEEEELE